MKRILLLILAFCATAPADEVRVSFMFVHYSVGQSAVNNCQGPSGSIRNTLDTMTVIVGVDTAAIAFRSYNINYDHQDSALGDTVEVWYPGDWCYKEDRINTGFDYDFQSLSINRNRIFHTDGYSPLLRNFFQRPFKEDSLFWYPFIEHQIPYDNGDMVTEHYDMVIFKNPYMVWQDFTHEKADSIKKWYKAVRDSVINHPEINVAFAMGTPLAYETGGEADFNSDTTLAKIVYELSNWVVSDSFIVHSNSDTAGHRNVWTVDTYRPMCETGEGASNRYCLKNDYWGGYNDESHLSGQGMEALQSILIDFIRQATEDIVIQRSTQVTRRDIDRKILDFREGSATLPEVLDLIEQYNNGG